MTYTIQNQNLTATFKTKGAELSSLIDKKGIEYIWQGDPKFWARHTPVLFPIVGRLKEDTYFIDGKCYQMGQHGFARDAEFELVEQSETEISFKLNNSVDNYSKYPFDFELVISYKLSEKQLEVGYLVNNTQASPIWFSIGAHPAFNCPISPEKKKSDYFLNFGKKVDAEAILLKNGLLTEETNLKLEDTEAINIADDLFRNDALVFKNFPSNEVALADENQKPYLKVVFEGFPFLGIWSKSKEGPFVCIEPWFGIADHVDSSQNFRDKEGMIQLEGAGEFSASYFIEVF
ncbi:aldose 1-epimerase family protein [Flexithrix dorotheae]|uniref:aldose 1-epimerase family protein n=1 Tax=Flexithrix dorotheae TaxID=70993 RepID=UPI000379A717|nr:aldose 1-epimerase family protein [Flexithrix dorotheae]